MTIELEELGLRVQSEQSFPIMYKGRCVGTRRADLIVETSNKSKIIIELKAVQFLTSEHLHQLEYYLVNLDIDVGYLINFPHEAGFPDLEDDVIFKNATISGSGAGLSDRKIRKKSKDDTPHIEKVYRI